MLQLFPTTLFTVHVSSWPVEPYTSKLQVSGPVLSQVDQQLVPSCPRGCQPPLVHWIPSPGERMPIFKRWKWQINKIFSAKHVNMHNHAFYVKSKPNLLGPAVYTAMTQESLNCMPRQIKWYAWCREKGIWPPVKGTGWWAGSQLSSISSTCDYLSKVQISKQWLIQVDHGLWQSPMSRHLFYLQNTPD